MSLIKKYTSQFHELLWDARELIDVDQLPLDWLEGADYFITSFLIDDFHNSGSYV